MSEYRQYQIVALFFSCLVGVIVPLALLYPVWQWGIDMSSLSWEVKLACIGLICLGIWLVVIAYFTDQDTLKKVLESTQAYEVWIVIPYALYVGTRRLIFGRKK